MRKKIYLLAFVFMLYAWYQFYLFKEINGNTIIIVENESGMKLKNYDCNITYKEKKIANIVFSGEEILPVKSFVFKDWRIQELVVSSDSLGISKTKKIFPLPLKWVLISFYSDKIVIKNKYFRPGFE